MNAKQALILSIFGVQPLLNKIYLDITETCNVGRTTMDYDVEFLPTNILNIIIENLTENCYTAVLSLDKNTLHIYW